MKARYRVIRKTKPDRTRNTGARVDFVPELIFTITYEVQIKYSFFSSWETIWVCKNLEAAERLLNIEQTPTIITRIL